MTEQQQMLAEMASGLFAELGPDTDVAEGWARIDEVELAGLLVPEDQGGFGGGWDDAFTVFRLAGHAALGVPLVEATLAAWYAALAARSPTGGFGTIADGIDGVFQGGRFDGRVTGAAWGRDARFVVSPSPDAAGALLIECEGADVTRGSNPAGEPRDTLRFAGAVATSIAVDARVIGAMARAVQAAGAMDAVLAMSVGYVNERQQFGRPIAKFQAVQQALATFASEVAAADGAAMAATQAMMRCGGPERAGFEIAAAKLRANIAIGEATAIAHQVHGAIGFTRDYGLHPLTRRLWSWRSEFGGDAHWGGVLGQCVLAAGADRFWPDLADRTDFADTV